MAKNQSLLSNKSFLRNNRIKYQKIQDLQKKTKRRTKNVFRNRNKILSYLSREIVDMEFINNKKSKDTKFLSLRKHK